MVEILNQYWQFTLDQIEHVHVRSIKKHELGVAPLAGPALPVGYQAS